MNIIKLASINPDFLRKVLLLGAVGGAGTGLVQSLLRHRQAIVEDNEDEDDDVVAADVHQHKIASEALTSGMNIAAGTAEKANQLINFLKSQVAGQKQAPAKPAEPAAPDNRLGMLDYALGGTGLPLAFLASMTGVRGLYNRYERKELQNKMRDEQEALMAEIEREARSKSASDGRAPGRIDLGLMAVLGALGLTGITTGVLTDQMLTSQFPRVRQRSNSTRILTPRNSAATGQEEEEEEAKSASELLVHTVLSLENGDGDVTDAVKAAAVGLMPDATDQFLDRGLNEAVDFCKAASAVDMNDPLVRFGAVRAAVRSAFGPALCKLAAAEFRERCPRHAGEGQYVNREHPILARRFEKLAAVMVPAMLYLSDVEASEKCAGIEIPEQARSAVNDLLEGRPLSNQQDDEATSLVNASGTTTHGRTDRKREESDERPARDPIDALMTAG